MKVLHFDSIEDFGLFLVFAIEHEYKVDGLQWSSNNSYRIDDENMQIKYADTEVYKFFGFDIVSPEIDTNTLTIKF